MTNDNVTLSQILEKFVESGWDLIAVPSREYLDGKIDSDALISAVHEADRACGACGCEYDALYKQALRLLEDKRRKVSYAVSNDHCLQSLFLYGTYKEDGTPNFGLFCWMSYCWDGGLGVMAAIGGDKLTKDRIRKNGRFSANLVTEDLLPLADYFGNVEGYGADKMSVPFAVEKGTALDVPILSDSPVSFELEVTKSVPLDGSDVFLCKIRNVLVREDLAGKERTPLQRMLSVRPVTTTCGTYFSLGGQALGQWGEPMRTVKP